jgi:hypothetical protein
LALLALTAAVPGAAEDSSVGHANVEAVMIRGSSGSYLFQVTVRSPDTGCERYANWWEVVTPEGELVHRRILRHSHPKEQPFTRSGGPIGIDADREVIVRAHMHPGGYGGVALRGSPSAGFVTVELEPGFAEELGKRDPQPKGCAF